MSTPYTSPTFANPLSLRVDGNFLSTMSVAPNGRDAVLAGRKGLFVIDLDDPFAAPRWLHHETSWEVADVQWSPHSSKPSWIVSTSNQKAMVWNLARPSHDAIEHVLHSHTRAITDINFHPNHPELLATCSVDSFVLCWDLRTPKAPIHQWADWRAASSQVKWNFRDPHILASAHDSYILIWDSRKGAMPLKRIKAHQARINGIDWSREHRHELISCSNDMSVKFWSYDVSCETPSFTIQTDFPVARARHVPFGDRICGIMPLRGGNNSVYMVKYGGKEGVSQLDPSYVFRGHTEPVKDFVWRSRHHKGTRVDDREFQLVTWSADCDLRLWPVGEDIYDDFNYVKDQRQLRPDESFVDYDYKSYRPEPVTSYEDSVIIRKRRAYYTTSYNMQTDQFNHLNWISGIRMGQSAFQNDEILLDNTQPMNLGEEVSNVGHKFPKLRFERISVSTGNMLISLNGPWSDNKDELIFIRVEINFPKGYPSKDGMPKFSIEQTHDLIDPKRQELLKNLKEIAEKYCEARKFCLEPCMRFLLGEKVNMEVEEEEDAYEFEERTDENEFVGSINSVSADSASVVSATSSVSSDLLTEKAFDSTPVPKGCGAIWTPSGHLVCFFNPKEEKKETIKFGQQGFSLMRMEDARKREVDSDESDDSDESSSSSLANDLDILQYDRMYRTRVPEGMRDSAMAGGRPYGNNDNSQSLPTEKSQTTANSRGKHNRNIVKIYDFTGLIPAKMDLAFGYRVLGDTPENLALQNALVAENLGYSTIADCWRLLSILLVKEVNEKDSDVSELITRLSIPTHFFWGSHPFGGLWLARELMRYYEIIGDVQMLAMLSCMMYERPITRPRTPVGTSYTVPASNAVSRTTSFMAPHPHFHSAVSFGYRPSAAPERSVSTISSLSEDVSFRSNSPSIDPSMSHYKTHRRGIKQVQQHETSVPHSPSSVSSSIPSNVFSHSFDKFMNNSRPKLEESRSSGSLPQVKVQILNKESLDLFEDVQMVKMEGLMDKQKLDMYRTEYASLLFFWGLPVSRVKVLKFNYNGGTVGRSEYREHEGEIGWEGDGRDVRLRKCHFCLLRVTKRITACVNCNHIMHAECAMEWWEREGMKECPSGCGCHCLDHGTYERTLEEVSEESDM